ncbi:MAG: hypothetical protein IGS03_01910 [Candidatus Sericytochromatia bacterium]|nr:hypothetical protein [Candidatus Sericytochromatia bacterium]
MMKLHRLCLVSTFAAAVLMTSACGRSLPQPVDPCVEAAAFMRFSGATADCPPPNPNPEPPAPNPNPEPPAPNPQPPAPNPEPPMPNPQPPAPNPQPPAPNPLPPAPPQPAPPQPEPPKPAPPQPEPPKPAPPAPKPEPPKPEPPKPEPPKPAPPPSEADLFFKQLADAGLLVNPNVMANLIRETANLNVTGWSQGKHASPAENIAAMYDATRLTFNKVPASAEEYETRSMNFARTVAGAFAFYVDLKVSVERGELYLLKFDPASKQILGINKRDVAYAPLQSQYSAQNSGFSRSSVDGKIFFYGEEHRGLDTKRFVKVPYSILHPQAAAQMQMMNAYRSPYYR